MWENHEIIAKNNTTNLSITGVSEDFNVQDVQWKNPLMTWMADLHSVDEWGCRADRLKLNFSLAVRPSYSKEPSVYLADSKCNAVKDRRVPHSLLSHSVTWGSDAKWSIIAKMQNFNVGRRQMKFVNSRSLRNPGSNFFPNFVPCTLLK